MLKVYNTVDTFINSYTITDIVRKSMAEKSAIKKEGE